MKDQRYREKNEFEAKRGVVVVAHRSVCHHEKPGHEHRHDSSRGQRQQLAGNARNRLRAQTKIEEAQIYEQNGATEDGQREQMADFHHRKAPRGIPHRDAEVGCRQPAAKHQKSISSHHPPLRFRIFYGFSRYAIMRPATMMPLHSASEITAAARARIGMTVPTSQLSTLRKIDV